MKLVPANLVYMLLIHHNELTQPVQQLISPLEKANLRLHLTISHQHYRLLLATLLLLTVALPIQIQTYSFACTMKVE